MNDMIWAIEVVALAIIATWLGFLAVYWKRKYYELYDAQRRYLRAHERARTTWPPIA